VTTNSTGEPIEDGFRMKAATACEIFLRIARSATEHYGDLDSLTIYLAVVMASVGAVSRDPDARVRYSGKEPIPDDLLRAISRRAISESTGLPRETVRRKIARLIADGHLIEDGDGVRPPMNVLEQRSNYAFARSLVGELERAADRLSR
jgi:hypothetical protein